MGKWLAKYGWASCGGLAVFAVAFWVWVLPRVVWVSDARALARPGSPVEHGCRVYSAPLPPSNATWSYSLGKFEQRSARYVVRWDAHTSLAGDGECRLTFTVRSVGSRGKGEMWVTDLHYSFEPASSAAIGERAEAGALATEVGVPLAADMEESDSGPGWWLWRQRDGYLGATLQVKAGGELELRSLTPDERRLRSTSAEQRTPLPTGLRP